MSLGISEYRRDSEKELEGRAFERKWQGRRRASRSVPKAQLFIDECSAEVPQRQEVAAVGSYAELIEHEDVDAIYIPLPTGLRKSGFWPRLRRVSMCWLKSRSPTIWKTQRKW